MKRFPILLPCLLALAWHAAAAALPQLKVSDNRRFLVTADGQPFFWLGDTAWELFHRLNREEAERYLTRRAEQGFSVIQAVALAELGGLVTPNAYGHYPLREHDPAQPNEDYFKHVDWIVAKANSLGLYIGMLPTWGNGWHETNGVFNAQNAATYGEWLGRRYKDAGVIWILGGDRLVENDRHREILEAMARGLRKGDEGAHLITFHPRGGSSSANWFHEDGWLDFNMAQTEHTPRSVDYVAIERDYARTPAKPCLVGEPAYEYPPDAMPPNRPVGALQVRRNAYWALFAGALGHTYGTHPVWQMYAPPRKPLWDVKTPWYDALDLPGAMQLAHLKTLMLSRPFLSRIPDQGLILDGQGEKLGRVQATRDGTPDRNDATYVMAYFPEHRRVTINTGKFAAPSLRGYWVNPRTGGATAMGVLTNKGTLTCQPPTDAPGQDWVLLLDDATKDYPPPRLQNGDDGLASGQSASRRIASRALPSVFMAWNPADNLKGEDRLDTAARHDLLFNGPEFFGLEWNHEYPGLATSFTPASLPKALERRRALLKRNPGMILIMEIRYRDAWGNSMPTSRGDRRGFLPADHKWWKRGADGKIVAGWEEGGFLQLDFANPEYREQVARQCEAAVKSGVVDGVMLDWWVDDGDRLALVTAIRHHIGDDALILVNANDHPIPRTAAFVNGLFMECCRSKTPGDWKRIAETLAWAEKNLRAPRINCLETWYQSSRADENLMRATTALSLVLSDGYCLFSDPNPLPTPDHLHNWYPFWERGLGKAAAPGVTRTDGVMTREFAGGTAAYNSMGNETANLEFAETRKSRATGKQGRTHTLGPCDGDLFLKE